MTTVTTDHIRRTLDEILTNTGSHGKAMEIMEKRLADLEKDMRNLQRDFDRRVPEDLPKQLSALAKAATQGETIAMAIDKTGILKIIGGAVVAGMVGAGGLYAIQQTSKGPQPQQPPAIYDAEGYDR